MAQVQIEPWTLTPRLPAPLVSVHAENSTSTLSKITGNVEKEPLMILLFLKLPISPHMESPTEFYYQPAAKLLRLYLLSSKTVSSVHVISDWLST